MSIHLSRAVTLLLGRLYNSVYQFVVFIIIVIIIIIIIIICIAIALMLVFLSSLRFAVTSELYVRLSLKDHYQLIIPKQTWNQVLAWNCNTNRNNM